MYHYITFLRHPSDSREVRQSMVCLVYHYITFLRHPSDYWYSWCKGCRWVPLHYISEASFRPMEQMDMFHCPLYHYITFLRHPSDTGGIFVSLLIFVPLHYISEASFRQPLVLWRDGENGTITLHFWGILPTTIFQFICDRPASTITLHFWGILPTYGADGYVSLPVVPLHYISEASFRHRRNFCIIVNFCTITLHFWGILPTTSCFVERWRKWYHYITFLRHPSDHNLSVYLRPSCEYHYITFLRHPSDPS